MTSAFDDLFADTAGAALFAVHGQSVERWPDGVEDEAETVTAMWLPDETGQLDASRNGEKTVLRGTLQVLSAQTVDRRDSWLISDEFYRVDHVADATGGLKNVRLVKIEKTITNRTIDRR